ncbi:MAG: 3-hydroxyacyl-CoA dehydrogenase/enoyl-CoA hydratase family protein [Acidobacteriota bacterium]
MIRELNRVAVLGAGTMGAQIAAHFANVDVPTVLLDVPSEGPDRSAVARRALADLKKMKPPPLYLREKSDLIQVGNFDDDLAHLSTCDWIIEAIVERLDIKQHLWQRVEAHRGKSTIVSTNTSGLPVARIAEERSEEFRQHWLGTHFFNPPRYMKLLEVIPGPDTLPEVIERVTFLGDRLLGKGVVLAKDQPNFVANRIGTFAAARAMSLMRQMDLTIEEVDALTGPAIGRPKTGTFRLADLVGIDVLSQVGENLYHNLPDDPWREIFRPDSLARKLISKSWTGRKAGQGFYKKVGKEILVLDLKSFDYRPQRKPELPSLEAVRQEPDPVRRVATLLDSTGKTVEFLWPLLRDTFAYTAGRIPEITDDLYQVDRALRWGFNWELGPFQLWQGLGVEKIVERSRQEGVGFPSWIDDLLSQPHKSFYIADPDPLYFDLSTRKHRLLPGDAEKISLQILKKQTPVICSNSSASLVDLGDGVACLEFHSKMNSLDDQIIELSRTVLEEVNRNFLGLVVGNQGQDFSVGANLFFLLTAARQARWKEIDQNVRAFQQMTSSFRHSPRPVVAAPFGRTLAGGAEVCLGCDVIVASAESYMGLVEVGVGLVPAGGGTKELLVRNIEEFGNDLNADRMPGVKRAFQTIGTAQVSKSAEEARQLRFLRRGDRIEIHPDRVLSRAKKKVLSLVEEGYVEPHPLNAVPVTGAAGLAVLRLGLHLMRQAGYATEYDVRIGEKLAYILTGGDLNHPVTVSDQYLLDLEREAFLSLCGEEKTQQRIEHTLKTGKPLRN